MKRLGSALLLAATLATPCITFSQEKKVNRRDIDPDTLPVKTIELHNSRMNDANELLTALRNIFSPTIKIFLIPDKNLIAVRGTADEISLAERLIAEWDRPKRSVRVSYTITEMESGKRKGAETTSVVVTSGERAQVKNGNRVPVMVSSTGGANGSPNMTYLDVGWNTDTTAYVEGDRVMLRTKVERSSVAEERNPANGAQDPVIRQSIVDGTLMLVPGKPTVLGAIDVPGTTRHFDLEVTATVLP